METKRTVLTTQKSGAIKKNVVLEQMAKITTRASMKRTSDDAENEDPGVNKISGEGLRKQAQVVNNVLQHLSGKDFETKCLIVSKLIDKEGPEFAALLTAHSVEIQHKFKLSAEKTAALISGTGTSDSVWTKVRTALNKTFGWNPLASHKKVKHARQEILPVHRDDWVVSYPSLYKNKQGKNKRTQAKTCVLMVKNLKEYIEKLAKSEAESFSHLKDGDTIHVCYDADGGGGRFVAEFAFLNRKDNTIKLHPFLIYEGTDVRANLELTLGYLTDQFSDIENSQISVEGKMLNVVQFGVFDLCALNAIIGKQNHSATYFDAWTNVSLNHIQNHNGKHHTPSNCPDISFLSLSDFDTNITLHTVKTGAARASGRLFGSVVGQNLLPLENIFRYIPPLMHIIMGLGNNVFNELKRVVIFTCGRQPTAHCTLCTALAPAPAPASVHFILHIEHCTLHTTHLHCMLYCYHFTVHTVKRLAELGLNMGLEK